LDLVYFFAVRFLLALAAMASTARKRK